MGNITQNTVNFITNLVLKVILAIAAIAALIYAAGNIFNPANLFSAFKREKPVLTIENTPITVQDVRAVGKLVTANYYDEMIIQRTKKDLVKTYDNTSGEIIIIQKANVRVGVDLANLKDEDIMVEGDTTVRIKLPPVEILHVIMNPTDTDIYSETKGWSLEQMKEVLSPAEEYLKEKVYASQVMDRASQSADEIITEFFTSFGYKHVYIQHAATKIAVPLTEVQGQRPINWNQNAAADDPESEE